MLLGLSIHLRDGMSIMSTVLLSLLSSLIGLGNHWTLKLQGRKNKKDNGTEKRSLDKRSWFMRLFGAKAVENNSASDAQHDRSREAATAEQGNSKKKTEDHAPPGDVVIRYPKGSFLVVRCHEDVARELYFAPEEIDYLIKDAWIYRLLSLVGTMMLMGGVICLANARIESQIAWAGSYMLLGAAYWIVAALPPKVHWDTSSYKVHSEALSDSVQHTKSNIFAKSRTYPFSTSENFTGALWKAIVASKDTAWVRRNDHCPATDAWDDWLQKAKENLLGFMEPMEDKEKENRKQLSGIKTWRIPPWDPQQNLQSLLKEHKEKEKKATR